MLKRPILLAFGVALIAGACSDTPTTTHPSLQPAEPQFIHGPVSGTNLLNGIEITGTLAGSGEEFSGTLNITGFDLNEAGELTATGQVFDAAGDLVGEFTGVLAELTEGGQQNRCDILFLQLGPIELDLLGLLVDVSQITIDVTAERGPGNLLGNLLCAVAGLLDRDGPLTAVENLLNRINDLLG